MESIALGSEQLTRFGPVRTSEEPYFLCRTGISSLKVRCQVVYRRQKLENFARKGPGTSLRPGRSALRRREKRMTARKPERRVSQAMVSAWMIRGQWGK